MSLWGNQNNANNAPKYDVDDNGHTGQVQYGNTVFYVTGTEGYGIAPGWARKIVGTGGRAGRITWEPLIAVSSPVANTNPITSGQPIGGLLLSLTRA